MRALIVLLTALLCTPLLAAAILAVADEGIALRLDAWRAALSASIPEEPKDD